MKNRRHVTLKEVKDKVSKKEILTYLKLKNLKGGSNSCPPPFEVERKKN